MTGVEQKDIFSSILTKKIEEKGLKQIDVARAIGVSRTAISDWCKGVKIPRTEKFDELASFLGMTRQELMGWSEEEVECLFGESGNQIAVRDLLSGIGIDLSPTLSKEQLRYLVSTSKEVPVITWVMYNRNTKERYMMTDPDCNKMCDSIAALAGSVACSGEQRMDYITFLRDLTSLTPDVRSIVFKLLSGIVGKA